MNFMEGLGSIGFTFALIMPALGSASGINAAGMAAIGAWKKLFIKGEPAPFIMVTFVGAPLSQLIYGMILMNAIIGAPETVMPLVKFNIGFWGGTAIGASAWFQGRIGALASDALAEGKKGFAYYIMVLGIVETVGLFVMVFFMTTLR